MTIDPLWHQATTRQDAPKNKVPFPIVLVALFQFIKAGALIFLALALCGFGAVFTSSDTTTIGLILLSMVLAVILVIAIYLIRSGVLLLKLEKTARRRLMWNIAAGWLIYGTSFSGLLFGQTPSSLLGPIAR